uniref:Iron-sulfur cluster carrier protein n=1 Tax=Aliivibrio wodanis TaxID=80852 RepID=A0A5Q4YYX0_9GAMM|nr:Iron-sulfur cluster carrier protein [Aliivibrio wodanis]
MFDLVDLLKKEEQTTIKEEKLTTVLFHQTEACRELVLEAFRFEGITAPAIIENSDSNIKQHVREASIEIVLVELNNSLNVSLDMERISHLLPNNASVIVIGSEDAISTIRNLKAMGFYYLFWPITKQELIDFVRSVSDNRMRNSGLGQNRIAKKVAIWGSKGGVGTSMLTSEIAFQLSEQKNSNCIVVDHNFQGGNLDILMGLRQFEKRKVQRGALSGSLDVNYALGMTRKINEMLSILALTSEELNELELKDYVGTLNKELSKQTNFIIEDLSRSANSRQDLNYVASDCDSILLVLEPTVSSLREATKVKSDLEKAKSKARFFIVLNYTMQEKYASVSVEEIEKYLRQPLDVTCPYEPKLDALLLEGKRLYQQKGKMSESLCRLTSLLIGEKPNQSKSNVLQRLLKRV